MNTGLRGKSVLVTGASRGIGRSIALGFAAEGANVAIVARDPGPLGEATAAIRAAGVKAVGLSADLSDESGARRVVAEATSELGGLDVLVTNAGSEAYATLTSTSQELFARIEGKLRPAVWSVQAASEVMKGRGSGAIVCVGGIAARQTFNALSGFAAFNKGKSSIAPGMGNAALANFVKHASDELGAWNITVNVVHPGVVRSDRFPGRLQRYADEQGIDLQTAEKRIAQGAALGRVVEPEEVAHLIVFLASDLARAITGQAIAVDAGALRGVPY